MAAPTDIRVTFTIDLAPYVAGLKSMLQMTQAAGRQITPLLNVQMKAPDFAPLTKQLQMYDDQLRKMAKEAAEVGQAAVTLVPPIAAVAEKTDAAAEVMMKKRRALRMVKREAMESFGAISFLAISFTSLAQQALPASQSMQKLSQSLSQGISAGFGLAGILSMVGIASGGLAVAIGGVVAIGTVLLSFFSDAKSKAEATAKALEAFERSLRGRTTAELVRRREELSATIETQKQHIKTLDEQIAKEQALATTVAAFGQIIKAETPLLKKLRAERVQLNTELDKNILREKGLIDMIDRSRKQQAEIEKETAAAVIAAISDRYERERAEIRKTRDQAIEDAKVSEASEEAKAARIVAAHAEAARKLSEIDQQEKEEKERRRREDKEKELQRQKFRAQLERETQSILFDIEEQRELRAAKTEIERLAIQETFALKRLDLQYRELIAFAKTEEEKTLLTKKWEAERQKIRAATATKAAEITVALPPIGSIAAHTERIRELQEKLNRETNESTRRQIADEIELLQERTRRMGMTTAQILEEERRLRDERRRLWMEAHQFQMALIDGITAGHRQMFDTLFIRYRRAKDESDAIWLAMRNTALGALGQILTEQIRVAFVGAAVHEAGEARKTESTLAGVATRIGAGALEVGKSIGGAIASAAAWVAAEAQKTAAVVAGVAKRLAALAGEMAKTLALAAANILTAIAAAVKWQIATFGPFALVTIPASVAAIFGLFRSAKSALGLEKGGELKKGKRGFIEGMETEIIAPEKTFYQVMTERVIPRLIIEQEKYLEKMDLRRAFNAPAIAMAHVRDNERRMSETIKRIIDESKIALSISHEEHVIPVDITIHGEFKQKGTEMIATVNETQRIELRLGRKGLKVR